MTGSDRYQRLRDAIAAGPTPGPRFQGRSPHAYCVYDKQCWYAQDGSRHGETPNLVVTVSPDNAESDAQFIAAADPETIDALIKERDALRKLVAAGCLLSAESEEIESDDGMARCAGLDYWHEFEEKLDEARLLIEGDDNAPL